jgi:adenylate cyclase
MSSLLEDIARIPIDLPKVMQSIVERVKVLCRGDYGGAFFLEGDQFRWMFGTAGADSAFEEYEAAHPTPIGPGTLLGRVGLSGEVVHIPDVQADPGYDWPGPTVYAARTMLGVPIKRGERLIGALELHRRNAEPFSAEDIERAALFARQASIALGMSQLLEDATSAAETILRQRQELARFVSPQVADLLSDDAGDQLLEGHRREISVVVCDLRGFTAFSETAEPEEILAVLRAYHAAVGEAAARHEATLEHFAGDGVLMFFNDPVRRDDHPLAAIGLGIEIRETVERLAAGWARRGHELGIGVGIAEGYATLGRVGFEGRYDYAAIGTVVNLASRLAGAAQAGQILVDQRAFAAVEDDVDAEDLGMVEVRGLLRPVRVHAVSAIRPSAEPALESA